MSMIINVSLSTGVTASYWRILSANINVVTRDMEITVQGWLSEDAFNQNFAPVTTRVFQAQGSADSVAGLNTFLAATVPGLLAQG